MTVTSKNKKEIVSEKLSSFVTIPKKNNSFSQNGGEMPKTYKEKTLLKEMIKNGELILLSCITN